MPFIQLVVTTQQLATRGPSTCTPISSEHTQTNDRRRRLLGAYGDPTAKSQEKGKLGTKLPKIECPEFSCDDFPGWITWIEKLFDVDLTHKDDKVRVVMMHLSREALHWHMWYVTTKGNLYEISWKDYIYAIRTRF